MCKLRGCVTASGHGVAGWVQSPPPTKPLQGSGISPLKTSEILDAKSDRGVGFYFCLEMTNSGILMHILKNSTHIHQAECVTSRPTTGGTAPNKIIWDTCQCPHSLLLWQHARQQLVYLR